ncbi:hypothetical protein [Paenibacillus sp.]|uniref:hypothetical protein n=1 Tax=Paenibacillus sp. TaxID=58172 RepID=UPI002D36F354|nr:hypothetical protein [Paenibacillus sp.]HZG84945.1 hypothetical protein [Paenibacillus sp.]
MTSIEPLGQRSPVEADREGAYRLLGASIRAFAGLFVLPQTRRRVPSGNAAYLMPRYDFVVNKTVYD